ncbi:hypothetical protein D3C78_1919760 [compost metagenome]
MHGDVVPGRHDLAVLGFAGIKPGAHVSVGASKDHQRFGAALELLPLPIGPGKVAVEGAMGTFVDLQQQR